MNDTEARVTQCFANVFPDLSPDQIPTATPDTVAGWDSVAHITLLSAISEEFGVEFEPEDYAELDSYRSVLDAVKGRTAAV